MSSTLNQRIQDQKLPREKVFRDPVLEYVYIHDQVILDLINTREFQRLRRIKQLGTAYYTFHGAEHSRFNHSLGVYEMTRRIISNFNRNYQSKDDHDGLWDNSHRMVALCAALLHDIGHGPFSHTFEGIFHTDHEWLTQEIITSETTQINAVLRRLDPDLPEQVASVIDHTYPNQQVVGLISSQLDADRMDYLLRDAYYAGVSYGTFDLTRILRVLRPFQDKIVLDYNGMHAVEDYIVSRYQMYMQVYFHPVSRGMEEILRSLLTRAKVRYQDLDYPVPFLEPFLTGQWTLEDYLNLDDHVMSSYFTHWIQDSDPILADLADRFLSRRPFKSVIAQEESWSELNQALYQEVLRLGYDPTYYLGDSQSLDLPYDYYRPGDYNQKTQIELVTKNGQLVELSQVSPLVHSLAGKTRGDRRFFFPREILEDLWDQQEQGLPLTSDQEILAAALANEESLTQTYAQQERLFD